LKKNLCDAWHNPLSQYLATQNQEVRLFHWFVFRCLQYSVNKAAATFGQQLLDMRYVDEMNNSKTWMSRRQRTLLALLTIGGAWIDSRIDDVAAATRNVPYFKQVSG
jgi:hypothetical protein